MSSAALQHPPPKHRRPRLTLYRYVAFEALRPTLFTLVGLTVVVLTTNIIGFSELVINRGLPARTVAWMVLLEGVPVAGRMVPFAMLVGALVALGRMGADREILALEASGVAAARLVWPVVSFAGVMTIVALVMGLVGTPWASRRLDHAYDLVSRVKPWAHLRAGSVQSFGGWQLEAREVSASGQSLRGVQLWMPGIGETIFAREGRLATVEDGTIEITLFDGTIVLPPGGDLRQLRFEKSSTFLPRNKALSAPRDKDRIPRLPLDELFERARSFVPTLGDPLPRASLEIHRRVAYPAATLVFGFLAVPLFVARRSFSRASGGVLAPAEPSPWNALGEYAHRSCL